MFETLKLTFKFNKSKVFKSFLFFSFIFNVLVANGYSYMILSQVATQLYTNTTTVFKMDDNHIVLAKTVKKDVENILSLNNSMLSIAGIVDSLFNTANENIVENQSTVELKTETSRNLVFSMFDVFYIFSLSDLLVTLKLGNKINFIEDMNQNNNFGMNERIILKNNGLNNNLYDVIKHFFIIQNIGNHDKVFLNILKNFNIG